MLLLGVVKYDPRVLREVHALRKAGYRVDIISSEYFPRNPIDFLIFNLKFIKEGFKKRASVYHAHDLCTLFAGVFLKKLLSATLIYDAHEIFPELTKGFKKLFWYMFERILIKYSDKVITVNKLSLIHI